MAQILKLIHLFFLMLSIGITGTTAHAAKQTASANIELKANQVHVSQLKNLPKTALLNISLQSDNPISALVSKHLNEENKGVLIRTQVENRSEFTVTIPETAHYYLTLKNLSDTQSAKVELSVNASVDDENISKAQKQLQLLEDNLRKYFVFDNVIFTIQQCKSTNTYTSNNSVIICQEFLQQLIDLMEDKQKAQDALLFALLHEFGHVVLKQWGYPFYDNEEVTDEFATALLIMFNQKDRARSQAEFFEKLPTDKELEFKKTSFDRHPLSIQRARNILKWIDDPKLVKKWQKIFVPHYQTIVLEKMLEAKHAWIDRELVDEELTRR